MTARNRDWRSFQQRWRSSSRLGGFLVWSLLLHAVLAGLLLLPLLALHHDRLAAEAVREQRQIEEQKKKEEEEREVEKIAEQAREEFRELLKQELAQEELKKLFHELTHDFLTEEQALEYWHDLFEMLEPELAELGRMLEESRNFDPTALEMRLQQAKEKLVEKLAETVAKKQLEPVRQQVLEQAKQQAKMLAEKLKKGVEQMVGPAAGEEMRKKLEAERKAAEMALSKAQQDLTQAAEAARSAAQELGRAKSALEKAQQQAGGKPLDKQADLRKAVQAERTALLAASRQLTQAEARMKAAGKQLAAQLPKTAAALSTTSAGKAVEQTQAAAKQAGELKPAEAARTTAAAEKEAKQVLDIIRQAQATLLAQRAGQQLEDLARENLEGAVKEGMARSVEQKLGQGVESKLLPGLKDKVGAALEQQLRGQPAATPAAKKALQEEVKKLVGQELAKLDGVGKAFVKGVASKLPPRPEMESPEKGKDGAAKATEAASKAEQAGQAMAERKLNELLDSMLKHLAPVQVTAAAKSGSAQTMELLRRLDNIQNQLGQQRKDVLGFTNQASLAALRQRFLERQDLLSRGLGMGMDRKAYEAMVNHIKDRGRITGAEWERVGAAGAVSRATEEVVLRPALVSLPELPPEPVDPKAKAERKVVQPTFPTHRFEGIPFLADDAIKIDGDLSDWKDVPQLKLDPVFRGPKLKGTELVNQPIHQIGYIAYCPRGIVVAIAVIDTSGKLENHHPVDAFWLNDCVEIYFDTQNTKYNRRGEPNTHQFFAFPFGHKEDDRTGGYESLFYLDNGKLQWKKVAYPHEEMPRAAKKTERGWTLEMLIPKAALRRGEVAPGRIIGFNLQIDTGTNLYYFWTCAKQVRTSEHPDTWGDIQFLGSDGKIELVAADGKSPLKAVVPGEPLRVRVTDPDMNLHSQKKDRISVTLRTERGDTETLILEETGLESGVFLGSIKTRLNIGGRQAGALELFEGETVTVEYLDQARAFGERNVPLHVRLPVSSLGSRLGR